VIDVDQKKWMDRKRKLKEETNNSTKNGQNKKNIWKVVTFIDSGYISQRIRQR